MCLFSAVLFSLELAYLVRKGLVRFIRAQGAGGTSRGQNGAALSAVPIDGNFMANPAVPPTHGIAHRCFVPVKLYLFKIRRLWACLGQFHPCVCKLLCIYRLVSIWGHMELVSEYELPRHGSEWSNYVLRLS